MVTTSSSQTGVVYHSDGTVDIIGATSYTAFAPEYTVPEEQLRPCNHPHFRPLGRGWSKCLNKKCKMKFKRV